MKRGFIVVTVIILAVVGLFVVASSSFAISFKPAVGLPGFASPGETVEIGTDSIGRYIAALYTFSVYVGTFLAAIVIVIGGFLWLTAAGNVGQISTAKTIVGGAVSGLLLLLFSWVLLNTINPNLVRLPSLEIADVEYIPLEVSEQFCCTCGDAAAPSYCENIVVTPPNGDCQCGAAISITTRERCEAQDDCIFTPNSSSFEERGLNICKERTGIENCRLVSGVDVCQETPQCQPLLESRDQSGYCFISNLECSGGTVCNRAWDCTQEGQPPQLRTDHSSVVPSGCCMPPGRVNFPCMRGPADGEDCAAGLSCDAPFRWGMPELGTCQ